MLYTFKSTPEWEGGEVTHTCWGSPWFTLSDHQGFILVSSVNRDQTRFFSQIMNAGPLPLSTADMGAGSLSVGGVLGTMGCGAASLAPTPSMPGAPLPHSGNNHKSLQTSPNHHQLKITDKH